MDKIRIIIEYLSGELTDPEIKSFEQAKNKDPELQKDFNEIQEIWEIVKKQLEIRELKQIKDKDTLMAHMQAQIDIKLLQNQDLSPQASEFRKKFSSIMREDSVVQQQYSLSRKRMKIILPVLSAIAAVLILLLLPKGDPHRLSDKYYVPAEDPLIREIAGSKRADSGSSLTLFMQEKYDTYLKVTGENPVTLNALDTLCMAIALYETGNPGKAIEMLTVLHDSPDGMISYEANWYLSLLHIKENNYAEALENLKKIEKRKGIYKVKIKRLISGLK